MANGEQWAVSCKKVGCVSRTIILFNAFCSVRLGDKTSKTYYLKH